MFFDPFQAAGESPQRTLSPSPGSFFWLSRGIFSPPHGGPGPPQSLFPPVPFFFFAPLFVGGGGPGKFEKNSPPSRGSFFPPAPRAHETPPVGAPAAPFPR